MFRRRNANLIPKNGNWMLGYFIILLAVIPMLAYGGFRLYRWFNWTFGYESLVRHTIEETVKPECLRR